MLVQRWDLLSATNIGLDRTICRVGWDQVVSVSIFFKLKSCLVRFNNPRVLESPSPTCWHHSPVRIAFLPKTNWSVYFFFISCIDINPNYVLLKPSREILIFSIINFNYKICVFLYCSLVQLNKKKFNFKKWTLFITNWSTCMPIFISLTCKLMKPHTKNE